MVRIEERLRHIPDNSTVILEVSARQNPMDVIADFLKSMQNDSGVYVSANRAIKGLIDKDGKPIPITYSATGIRSPKGKMLGEMVLLSSERSLMRAEVVVFRCAHHLFTDNVYF